MVPSAARSLCALVVLIQTVPAPPPRQDAPALQAAVHRFFTTQEAEDVGAYLGQWSKSGTPPPAEQIRFVFESGDDKYSEIAIRSVRGSAERMNVRVSAERDRTTFSPVPGGPPLTLRSTAFWSLTFVSEGGDWKLLYGAPTIDALAEDLIKADTEEKRDALLAAEKDLLGSELISALARHANQASQASRYGASQIALERMRDVARLIGDPKAESEALQHLANALYSQRNMAGALRYYEARLALERVRDDAEAISQSLIGIASIRYTLAEYGAALAAYREALAIQETIADPSVIATTLISTGNVLFVQGDHPAAIADFTRGREISRVAGNARAEAEALEGMGRVFMAQGDYRAALDALAGVLAEAKSRDNRTDQGAALLSIGDAHFRLGNIESARRTLDEARGHFEATRNLSGAGRAWQAVAITDLVADRYASSEEEYRKSVAVCSTGGDRECVARAAAGLGFAQTAQEKFKEGIASYTVAVDAFARLKQPEQTARARVGLAQALIGSGAFNEAVTTAERAIGEATGIGNDDVLWRAFSAQANGLRKLRRRVEAIAAATSAVRAADRLLDATGDPSSAQVARDSSAAFATLALLQAEAGEAGTALDTVERMRAHDLRAMLAASERDISRGMTDEEREEERTIAVDLVTLYAQIRRERTLPKADVKRVAALQLRIDEATAKRTAQRQRLFARLPALQVWRGLAAAATHADAARVLADDKSVLLEMVVGEDTLLMLVARRGKNGIAVSAHFEPSGRRTIATRVSNLLDTETLRDPKAWKALAAEFIPELATVFDGATRAIVVPHEMLWRVPFEALATESGYVADMCSVVYAPSLTALVRTDSPVIAASGTSAVPGSVVAVVAPALPAATIEGLASAAPGWVLRTPASGDEEINALGVGVDPERTVVISGEQATEVLLRDRLRHADTIHIAAPFRINGASPLFSPLLVAPDPANDGTLEPREIMNFSLQARVAILSDGGAMSMRDAADRVPVVAWAWRAAGVPALVLPRWPTNPTASTEFLAALHARLRAGDAPDVAIQAVRASLRHSGAPPSAWATWLLLAGSETR
jgi:tetratricopeptide (TPR) repeat protein